MENNTTLFENETARRNPTTKITFDSFYLSLFVMYIPGIVTNFICICVLKMETRKSTMTTNVLLFCLCTTDFIAVCLSCFWHVSARLGMETTYLLCAFKAFLHPIMPLLTGAISLLMAVDRAIAFNMPFFYRKNITKKTWIICFSVVFFLLSFVSVLPHLGYGSMMTKYARGGKVSYRCSVFTYQTDPKKKIYHAVYAFLGLFLVAGIIGCNLLVVSALVLLRKRTVAVQNSKQRTSSNATEIRFAVIVGALACVFVTCWLPYNVWILYKLLDIPMDYEVVTKIHLLGGFNYSTDPFVYLIIKKTNRKLLSRVFCCLGLRSRGDITAADESTNSTFATQASKSPYDLRSENDQK